MALTFNPLHPLIAAKLSAVDLPQLHGKNVLVEIGKGMDDFAVKSLADAGKLQALALVSADRNDSMPAVASFKELGWPALDATSYLGLLAPAGTPREAILRVNAAANKALQLAAVTKRMDDVGYIFVGGTPEDYAKILSAEMEKWDRIIRGAGIRVNP